MPITAWKCPGCNGREVPLDHFATSSCGITHVHPSFAAAVLHHDRAHYARGSGVVEVSNGLGCPRQVGIELEDNAVNPLDYNAAIGGTAWHRLMEEVTREWSGVHGWPNTGPIDMVRGIQVEYVVNGKLGMVPIQGKIDVLRRAHLLIEDWKTKTCFKAAGIEKDGAEENDRAQVSIYAALVEQQDGWRPTRGVIWYRFAAAGLKPKPVSLMNTEEFLAYKPTANDTYTVLDLLRTTDSILRGHLRWQDTPLIGEGMFYGAKNKCSYCPQRDKCFMQAKGAPF